MGLTAALVATPARPVTSRLSVEGTEKVAARAAHPFGVSSCRAMASDKPPGCPDICTDSCWSSMSRAQVALGAVEQAGLHRGLAHALDQFAHEQRLELLGGFLGAHRGCLCPASSFEVVERACVHRQRLAGAAGAQTRAGSGPCQITSSSAFRAPAALMACKMASRSCGVAPSWLKARTTSASWAEGGIWMMLPGSWLMVMSLFCVTTVCALRQRVGLADDRGGTDGDGQVAVRNGARAQRDGLVEHDGAGAGVDDHLGRGHAVFQRQLFQVGDEADAGAGVLRGAYLHGAAVNGGGQAVAQLGVDGLGHLAGGLEV